MATCPENKSSELYISHEALCLLLTPRSVMSVVNHYLPLPSSFLLMPMVEGVSGDRCPGYDGVAGIIIEHA